MHLGLAPLAVSSRGEEEDWASETSVFIQFSEIFENLAIGFLPCCLIACWVQEKRWNDSNGITYPYCWILGLFGNWVLPLFSECMLGPGERLCNSNEISYPVFRILVILTIGSFACYLNAFRNAPRTGAIGGQQQEREEGDGMNESNDAR